MWFLMELNLILHLRIADNNTFSEYHLALLIVLKRLTPFLQFLFKLCNFGISTIKRNVTAYEIGSEHLTRNLQYNHSIILANIDSLQCSRFQWIFCTFRTLTNTWNMTCNMIGQIFEEHSYTYVPCAFKYIYVVYYSSRTIYKYLHRYINLSLV